MLISPSSFLVLSVIWVFRGFFHVNGALAQHGCQIAIWSSHDHGCAEEVLKVITHASSFSCGMAQFSLVMTLQY